MLVEGEGRARVGAGCAGGCGHGPGEGVAGIGGRGHRDARAPTDAGGGGAAVHEVGRALREARGRTRGDRGRELAVGGLEFGRQVVGLALVVDLDDVVAEGACALGGDARDGELVIRIATLEGVELAVLDAIGRLQQCQVDQLLAQVGTGGQGLGVRHGLPVLCLELLAAGLRKGDAGRGVIGAVSLHQVGLYLVVIGGLGEVGTEGEVGIVQAQRAHIGQAGLVGGLLGRGVVARHVVGRSIGPGGDGKFVTGRGILRGGALDAVAGGEVDGVLRVSHGAVAIIHVVDRVGLCIPDGVQLEHAVGLGAVERLEVLAADGRAAGHRCAPADKIVPAVGGVAEDLFGEVGVVEARVGELRVGLVGVGARDVRGTLVEVDGVALAVRGLHAGGAGDRARGVGVIDDRILGLLPHGIEIHRGGIGGGVAEDHGITGRRRHDHGAVLGLGPALEGVARTGRRGAGEDGLRHGVPHLGLGVGLAVEDDRRVGRTGLQVELDRVGLPLGEESNLLGDVADCVVGRAGLVDDAGGVVLPTVEVITVYGVGGNLSGIGRIVEVKSAALVNGNGGRRSALAGVGGIVGVKDDADLTHLRPDGKQVERTSGSRGAGGGVGTGYGQSRLQRVVATQRNKARGRAVPVAVALSDVPAHEFVLGGTRRHGVGILQAIGIGQVVHALSGIIDVRSGLGLPGHRSIRRGPLLQPVHGVLARGPDRIKGDLGAAPGSSGSAAGNDAAVCFHCDGPSRRVGLRVGPAAEEIAGTVDRRGAYTGGADVHGIGIADGTGEVATILVVSDLVSVRDPLRVQVDGAIGGRTQGVELLAGGNIRGGDRSTVTIGHGVPSVEGIGAVGEAKGCVRVIENVSCAGISEVVRL